MPANTAIIRQLSGVARLIARNSPSNGKATTPAGSDDLSAYFGPGLSVPPITLDGSRARGWQYFSNMNMVFTPRPDAEYSAQDLRNKAKYPLVRIAIENCKDVLTSMPRQIRAKKRPGEKNADVDKRSRNDPVLKMLNDFFDCPDGEHDWGEWLREWLEYVYVLDAPSILVQRDRGNRPRRLRITDGAFITRLVDEGGWTPQPDSDPPWAYQQLWSGTPATVGGIPFVNLTTDQLVYRPRNIVPRNTVSSFLYGFPPVEQMAEEIDLGQERLNFRLAYYTTGTIPDAMHIVPPNIGTDELDNAQKVLTSEMSGQTQKRSGFIKLIQGFVRRDQPGAASGDQVIFPKEKLLSEPFDDMHIRTIFYGIGASPTRLLKQMNRASAQTNEEAAEEQGTMPVAEHVRSTVNWIIARIFRMGFNAYEMTYDTPRELDPVKRAEADASDVKEGIITRDQARENRGMDPVGGDASRLMVDTPNGPVPVELDDAIEHAGKLSAAKAPPPDESDDGETPGQKKTAIAKRRLIQIDPAKESVHVRQALARLEHSLIKVFHRQRDKAVAKAGHVLKVRKADSPKEKADQIFDAIKDEFDSLPVEARYALEQAALSGAGEGLLQLEVNDTGLLSSVNDIAADHARTRAAEMVGMKYDENGDLVPNPRAKWAISNTTRDRLREIVTNAFEQKTAFGDVIEQIRDADIFSEYRAQMIARTEVANAQVRSNFEIWKRTGLVTEVKWLAVGPDPCPICLDNDELVRDLGEAFPSGDVYPTAHPHCYCILQAVSFVE